MKGSAVTQGATARKGSDSGNADDDAHNTQDSIDSLAEQITALAQKLKQTSNDEYAKQARLKDVGLEEVKNALRPGAALVEYAKFTPYDFSAGRSLPDHYVAFVLNGGSGDVISVDLGPADAIDSSVNRFRYEVLPKRDEKFPNNNDTETNDFYDASDALRKLIWEPLEAYLAGDRRVYVAPEGEISLVPFEALAKQQSGRQHRFLVEDKELVYLNTGRDLARLALTARQFYSEAKSNTAVLFGNPSFGAPTWPQNRNIGRNWPQVAALGTEIGQAAKDLQNQKWTVKMRTGADATVEEAEKLTGAYATVEAGESVSSPRILQFATHGEYLGPGNEQTWDNPLFRSMLIMAGANGGNDAIYYNAENQLWTRVGNQWKTNEGTDQPPPTRQLPESDRVQLHDVLLTAYDVSAMNLHGTQLVNLTACETGLGDVTPQGVVGLRQGFMLAGARSITVALWKLWAKDYTAQAQDFYDRWLDDNANREYQHFHESQLNALANSRKKSWEKGFPWFWAGVVYVGDPGDLQLNSALPVTTNR
jgi:CHAT domain-containing protein